MTETLSALTHVMVTGHRTIANTAAVLAKLVWIIQVLNRKGHDIVGISGGAMGADSLWARACIEAGSIFDLEVPNRWYFEQYRAQSMDEVQWLMSHADTINFTVHRPEVENWRALWGKEAWWKDNFTRNRAMIDKADMYIAVSDEDPMYYVANKQVKGGTAACIRDLYNDRNVDEILWLCPLAPDSVKRIVINR